MNFIKTSEPEEKREKDIMDGKKVPKPTATAEIEAIAIPEEKIQDQPEVVEIKPEGIFAVSNRLKMNNFITIL